MFSHLRTFALSLSLLTVGTWAYGQCLQQVQVLEYMGASPKSPLEGVLVGVSNAPQALSDVNGNLQLNFRTLKEGAHVQVRRIEKTGYEIFNTAAIQQWSTSDNETFRIVMCRSDRFKAMRDDYMQKASASYREQFNKERELLEAERKERKTTEEEYDLKLMQLQQFYSMQASQLSRYIDQFVRIDLSELDSMQSQLVQLVSEGRFDDAISAYEKADYLGKYSQQIADIQKIDSAQAQLRDILTRMYKERLDLLHIIYRQVTLYQLAGGRTNYGKAYQLLKGVADADTTDFDANWLYNRFANEQNMVPDVVKYTTRCLNVTGREHRLRRINCYRLLSEIYSRVNQPDQEEYYADKAIEICEEAINEGHPTPSIIELYASLMLNRSEKCLHAGKVEEAKKYLEIAEGPFTEAYREFETDKSRYYMSFVLDTKASILHAINPADPQVISLSDTLLNMLRPHCMETMAMMQSFASALNNRITYLEKGSQAQEDCALESYEFMKRMYSMNPNGNDLTYIIATCDLAETYINRNKSDEAVPFIEQVKTQLPAVEARYKKPFPLLRTQFIYLQVLQAKLQNASNLKELAKQGLEEFNQLLPEEQKQHEYWRNTFEVL